LFHQRFFPEVLQGSACSYPGAQSNIIDLTTLNSGTSQTGSSSKEDHDDNLAQTASNSVVLSAFVPTGPQRVFQVIGAINELGTCDGFNPTKFVEGTDDQFFLVELGRVIADLTGPTFLTIPNTYEHNLPEVVDCDDDTARDTGDGSGGGTTDPSTTTLSGTYKTGCIEPAGLGEFDDIGVETSLFDSGALASVAGQIVELLFASTLNKVKMKVFNFESGTSCSGANHSTITYDNIDYTLTSNTSKTGLASQSFFNFDLTFNQLATVNPISSPAISEYGNCGLSLSAGENPVSDAGVSDSCIFPAVNDQRQELMEMDGTQLRFAHDLPIGHNLTEGRPTSALSVQFTKQ